MSKRRKGARLENLHRENPTKPLGWCRTCGGAVTILNPWCKCVSARP